MVRVFKEPLVNFTCMVYGGTEVCQTLCILNERSESMTIYIYRERQLYRVIERNVPKN